MADDVITRWDALLAAEVTSVKAEMGPEALEALSIRRGVALSADANARAVAVGRLTERFPELHKAYLAEFNARGIGNRSRNNYRG